MSSDGKNLARFLAAGGNSYWLTRFILLRALGLVYFIAFLVAARQIVPLVGSDGLTPADTWLKLVAEHFGSRTEGMLHVPGIFWFGISDHLLVVVAWCGVVLSLVVVAGYANAILMAVLWFIYMSYVHIGQIWYGYGWESQLLETGFLGIFLCPLLDMRPFPRTPPPAPVIWLFRWLGFRIMLGAGLIKLRGDPCWRDLTALYYHYETQPIPNPLSRYLHFLPHWFQKFSVLWNHFIELIVPWFSFYPRRLRHIAGALLISFQIILIISGNLSFLNWLTIIPFLACFDDTLLRRILPGWIVRKAEQAAAEVRPSTPQAVTVLALTLLIAVLSIAPAMNLMSGSQMMNATFDPLELVNTYGAFGSVGRTRYEIVFEGTDDWLTDSRTVWREYEFDCKPGDPMRRPCIITPYHYRLDWQIWFAAMSTPAEYPWTLHFVWKLLHNDPGTLSLLAGNPFPNSPPRYIRAMLYRYQFAPPGDPAWWKREAVGEWLPPLSSDDPTFRRILVEQRWTDYGLESK